jgi:hypothetical protein
MTRRSVHSLKSRRSLLVCLLLLAAGCAVGIMGIANAHASTSNSSVEQALIITIPFNGISGSNEEVEHLYKLEAELIKAIEHARAGEYDGNEIGDTTFTMYAYGPSADKLFDVARPILMKYPLPSGSRALKRYGKPGAKEERIPLGTGASK